MGFWIAVGVALVWRIKGGSGWPLGLDGLGKTDAVLALAIWGLGRASFCRGAAPAPRQGLRPWTLWGFYWWVGLGVGVPWLGVRWAIVWYFGVLGLGCVGVLRAAFARLSEAEDWRGHLALGLAFFGLYAGVGRYMCHVAAPTGDEPHYLMVAHSLWQDGDLDLADDFRDKAYEAFYPAPFGPRPWDIRTPDGRIYSWGGWLFPALLAVPYGLAGRAGAVLAVDAITAGALVLAYVLGRRMGAPHRRCAIGCAGVGVSLPILAYSSLIYPETLAGLLALAALCWIPPEGRAGSRWLAAAPLSVLALLRAKYLALVLPLLLGLAWASPRLRRLALLLGVGLLGYLALDWLLLAGEYSGRLAYYFRDAWRHAHAQGLGGLLGIWLDQEGGLLFYSPLLAAGFAALLWHPGRSVVSRSMALASALYCLAVGLYPVWFAEWSYPGRFLVPIVLLLPAAWASAAWGSWASRLAPLAASAALHSLVMAGLLLSRPELAYNYEDGTAAVLEALESAWRVPVCRYFPSLIRPTEPAQWLVVLLLALSTSFLLLKKSRGVQGRSPWRVQGSALPGGALWLFLLFLPLLLHPHLDTAVIETEDLLVRSRRSALWPDARPYYLRAALGDLRMGRRLKRGGALAFEVVTDPGRIEFWVWGNGLGGAALVQLAFDGYERHRFEVLEGEGSPYRLSVRVEHSPIELVLRNVGQTEVMLDRVEVHWNPFLHPTNPPPRALTPAPGLDGRFPGPPAGSPGP